MNRFAALSMLEAPSARLLRPLSGLQSGLKICRPKDSLLTNFNVDYTGRREKQGTGLAGERALEPPQRALLLRVRRARLALARAQSRLLLVQLLPQLEHLRARAAGGGLGPRELPRERDLRARTWKTKWVSTRINLLWQCDAFRSCSVTSSLNFPSNLLDSFVQASVLQSGC